MMSEVAQLEEPPKETVPTRFRGPPEGTHCRTVGRVELVIAGQIEAGTTTCRLCRLG